MPPTAATDRTLDRAIMPRRQLSPPLVDQCRMNRRMPKACTLQVPMYRPERYTQLRCYGCIRGCDSSTNQRFRNATATAWQRREHGSQRFVRST